MMQIYNELGIRLQNELMAFPATGGNAVGSYLQHFGQTPPANHLVADGRAVSRATYAALFAVIGVVFGVGDGSSTFNLPNMLGMFARGWNGTASGIDANRVFGSVQLDDFKSHTHTFVAAVNGSGGDRNMSTGAAFNIAANLVTNATGGTETRPVNIAVLPCIKYQMGDNVSGTGGVNLAADYMWTGAHSFARGISVIGACITPANLTQPLVSLPPKSLVGVSTNPFTGIPAWVTRIEVNIDRVSSSGVNPVVIQVGAGTLLSANYSSYAVAISATVVNSCSGISNPNGIIISNGFTAANRYIGTVILKRSPGTNIWIASGNVQIVSLGVVMVSSFIDMGASVLDTVGIVCVDAFDEGSYSISYQ